MNYPVTLNKDFKQVLHGVELTDPYVWLENKDDEEVLSWVAKQNELTSSYFEKYVDSFCQLKSKLQNNSLEKEYSFENVIGDSIIAVKKDSSNYYSIVRLNRQYENEQTLITALDFDNRYSLYGVFVSPTNEKMCLIYAIPHGAPRPSYLLCDLETKEILVEIKNSFSGIWSQDGASIIYSDSEIDAINKRNINYVKQYYLETKETKTLYVEDVNAPFLLVQLSKVPGKVIVKVCHDYTNASLLEINTKDKMNRWIIRNVQGAFEYIGETTEDYLILTNYQSPMSTIIAINIENPDFKMRKVIVAEGEYNIEGALSDGEHILINYLKNAASLLQVYSISTGEVTEVKLPEQYCAISGVGGFIDGKLIENRFLILSYESFLTSPCRLWFDFQTKSLQSIINNQDNTEDIQVEQYFTKSKDGENIPYFIVYQGNTTKDGGNAVLMYGYGGYNVSILPSYINPFVGLTIKDWVKEGHIYISCNIRGGNEYGANWHEKGSLNYKKNVFYDFISIAEQLIEDGWTSKKKIAICGGSNGGLLTTALTTMRPDLWGAVIASVPHTDMIRFKNDDRGFMYITEYGDPDDQTMFKYLLSYSPYHNVKEEQYPPIYIQTGEMDNNVPPYHGKKFAAKMQQLNKSENPVLLRVLAEGSHDRGKGDQMYQTHTEMQTFIKINLNIL